MYGTGRLMKQLLFFILLSVNAVQLFIAWGLVQRFVCMRLALLCVRVFCLSLSMLQAVNLFVCFDMDD
jgi:hypothetical protein